MKIGIFSGSFNPIHNGHTLLAECIRIACSLDEVWLLVTPNNPLKQLSSLCDEQLRLQMVKVAIQDFPHLKASDFEFHLPRPSYTVDTLRSLSRQYPQHSFSLIIGSDNMAIFNRWREYEYILEHYQVIVYPRQGDDIKELVKQYPQMLIVNNCQLYPISSTEVRRLIANHQPTNQYLHPAVEEIITKSKINLWE